MKLLVMRRISAVCCFAALCWSLHGFQPTPHAVVRARQISRPISRGRGAPLASTFAPPADPLTLMAPVVQFAANAVAWPFAVLQGHLLYVWLFISLQMPPLLPMKALKIALVLYGALLSGLGVLRLYGIVTPQDAIAATKFIGVSLYSEVWKEHIRPRLPKGPDERCKNFRVRAKRRVELSKSVVPWPNDSTRSTVEAFVQDNPPRKTLTLVGPAAEIQAQLLDDVLQGRGNVYRFFPEDEAPLDGTVSRSLRLNQTLDLEGIANCMIEARKPLLRRPRFLRRRPAPRLDPAVVIIDIAPWITNATTILHIVQQTTLLKDYGKSDILTVVRVPDLADDTLLKGLLNYLNVIRVPGKPA